MRALKWPVPVDNDHHPVGTGPILAVGTQGGDPSIVYVWTAEIDESHPARRVRAYGTGWDIPNGHEHIGSVVADPYVWHLYSAPWWES